MVLKTRVLIVFLCIAISSNADARDDFRLSLPVGCILGQSCHVQQFPDLDPGDGVRDPFCGGATYDEHKGTDFRVPTLADTNEDVAVLSAAEGMVLRVRDGEPDTLVETAQQRAALEGIECGNGVVIDHGQGRETQYCHLKRGSISVKPGQLVQRGEKIGAMGASGDAAFPHVHFGIRINGLAVDPFSRKTLKENAQTCLDSAQLSESLWDLDAQMALNAPALQLLGSGLAGQVIDHQSLKRALPEAPDLASQAMVGWAWLINLQAGDRISIDITAPDGSRFAGNVIDPLDRNKADYSLFAGKRGSPAPGMYHVRVQVLRGDGVVLDKTSTHTVG